MHAYMEIAQLQARKAELSDQQRLQVKARWAHRTGKKAEQNQTTIEKEASLNERINEIQKLGTEFKEMMEQAKECDISNSIHAAKIKRLGELHTTRAQSLIAKAKGEVTKAKREENTSKVHGIKNMSKAIGDPQAKPLTCVCRDQDT